MLVAAGAVGLEYTLPVTVAIVVLLAVLVISYRQVIEAFPNGGGAYAVARRHLGRQPSLIAAASLIVDYILNAAVGVSAGVEALTVGVPGAVRRPGLALPGGARPDHRGQHAGASPSRPGSSSCRRSLFIVAIAVVIIGGLVRSASGRAAGARPAAGRPSRSACCCCSKAFASGCSALTGRGGDRQRGARVPQAAGAAGAAHRDVARHPARRHAARPRRADPQVPRGAVVGGDRAGPADRARRSGTTRRST